MRVLMAVIMCVLAGSASARAQGTSWGLKGGINFATLSAEADPGPDFKYRIGVVAGGFFTFPLGSHLDVQPEALFSQQGATLDATGIDKATVRLDSIVVPALVRYRLQPSGKGLVFFAGPAIGFNVLAKATVDIGGQSVSDDIKDEIESIDYAVVFGAGWEGQRFLLDGRYTWGLSIVSSDTDDDDRARHRVISVLGGVRF
jgi:hypothetical protein